MTDREGRRIDQAKVLSHSLETILAETSTPEHSLASGSAAALSVSLAAALTCAAASALPDRAEGSGYGIQAENLRIRAVGLVDQNRDRYETARQALQARIDEPGYRDHRIGVAMRESVETLGLIAATGADTAELAAHVAAVAVDDLKPDAVAATVLAESGARVATILIAANLLSSTGSDALQAAESELASAVAASQRSREMLT